MLKQQFAPAIRALQRAARLPSRQSVAARLPLAPCLRARMRARAHVCGRGGGGLCALVGVVSERELATGGS